jgi:hypothetical protein
MRKVPDRSLWLGNAGDLRDARPLFDAEIQAVVELGDSEPFIPLPRELIRCRFPLSDGGENPDWLLRLAAESVAALLRAGVPLLVCCSAGMSRSVCIAAAGITIVEGLPLMGSVSLVTANGPADVSPSLLAQIQQAIA